MVSLTLDGGTPRQLHDTLLFVVKMSKRSFVTMGKVLKSLRDGDKYKKAVGAGADTWEDYLKQPEIGLNTGEANRLIQLYEELCLRLGYDEETISEIPVKNAHYLLPLVKGMKTRDEADELVCEATLLSQKDFKDKVYDKKAADLGLDSTRTYEYMIMRKAQETGKLEKVHDISSDVIKSTFGL